MLSCIAGPRIGTSCASDSVSMGPGGYCSGGADNITCSVDNNLITYGSIAATRTDNEGDVVALPFSARERVWMVGA